MNPPHLIAYPLTQPEAVIPRTRIPVHRLTAYQAFGAQFVDRFLADFPEVSLDQVIEALDEIRVLAGEADQDADRREAA